MNLIDRYYVRTDELLQVLYDMLFDSNDEDREDTRRAIEKVCEALQKMKDKGYGR